MKNYSIIADMRIDSLRRKKLKVYKQEVKLLLFVDDIIQKKPQNFYQKNL